ncbi:thiamine phosphate synthase [Niallia sp. 01092]|uniref:thiamine phosphate synthase n=1 Tax=unclassified Niallia TaxID=2837522 RepID=UPI003FD4E83F
MNLLAVTDGQKSVNDLEDIISNIHNFVDFIHVREKTKPVQEVYTLCLRLLERGVDRKKLVINDRLDVAALLHIENVHLPGAGLPVKAVKDFYPEKVIGTSVHTITEAKKAQKDGADYVLYGHCFTTNSKKGKAPIALESIQQMKQELSVPLYVIGGITEEKVDQLHHFGADGIAVMSGIFSSSNPLEAVKKLHERCLKYETKI